MSPAGLASAVLALSLSLRAAAAEPQPAPRRGPFESREGFLLAQRRLTLPALSPDPLARGATSLRVDLGWGNDFAWRSRGYMIDGEHRALALGVGRGVSDRLTLAARLPLLWRGGGSLDRFSDWIHALGFPDNGRPFFPRDQLRVTGPLSSGSFVRWESESRTGLGKLELEARLAPGRAVPANLALVGRLALPTGTGDFRGGGLEAAWQVVTAFRLGSRWDAYAGVGLALSGEPAAEGFEYRTSRPFGHLALEWRFARRWSALAQADAGGRLVTNLERYPGLQSYLRLGLKHDLGARASLEAAFVENLSKQQATTDFGVYLAVQKRF